MVKKAGVITVFIVVCFTLSGAAQECLDCHRKVTPNIVLDWQISVHSKNDVMCFTCHGEDHKSEKDVAKARIPTPDTCADCHEQQVKQY